MDKKNIVIKIGGSLLFRRTMEIDSQKVEELCNVIKNKESYDSIVIVVGGGMIAREYIEFIRKHTKNETLADLLGIQVSRINAQLFVSYLKDLAYPLIPKTIEAFSVAHLSHRIIIMGGLQPGQSTTSVALEIAEYIQAEQVIILTDVEGIYNKDPNQFKDAKLLENINKTELSSIIFKETDETQASAGEYRIFDAVSLQILKRSNIKVHVGSGKDLSKFKDFWEGKVKRIGTLISG
jgi:uridylate kinase